MMESDISYKHTQEGQSGMLISDKQILKPKKKLYYNYFMIKGLIHE